VSVQFAPSCCRWMVVLDVSPRSVVLWLWSRKVLCTALQLRRS